MSCTTSKRVLVHVLERRRVNTCFHTCNHTHIIYLPLYCYFCLQYFCPAFFAVLLLLEPGGSATKTQLICFSRGMIYSKLTSVLGASPSKRRFSRLTRPFLDSGWSRLHLGTRLQMAAFEGRRPPTALALIEKPHLPQSIST